MISVRTDLKNASNSGRPPMDDQSAGDPLFPGFPWVRAPGPGPPRRADRPCTSRIRHSVSITSGIVRPLTSHLAPLTSHLSPLTSHLSPLTSSTWRWPRHCRTGSTPRLRRPSHLFKTPSSSSRGVLRLQAPSGSRRLAVAPGLRCRAEGPSSESDRRLSSVSALSLHFNSSLE